MRELPLPAAFLYKEISLKKMFFAAALAAALAVPTAFAACTSIQSGNLLYSSTSYLAGESISVGVDPYGYNYQAHAYSGSFFNVYANGAGLPPYDGDDAAYLAANPTAASHWAWPYRNQDVAMKWNDAWLANKDCDGDGKLDRHYGFPSYQGSGAWLTNHDSWTVSLGGTDVLANDFLKVVAAPLGATFVAGDSYFGEGTVLVNGKYMGDRLWGEFAVVQYVLNDPSSDDHGLKLKGQINAGFGSWQP